MAIGNRTQLANVDAVIRELRVNQNALFYEDATTKFNLRVEGTLFATKEEITEISIVKQDQTIIDDLHVEGNIYGDGGLQILEDSQLQAVRISGQLDAQNAHFWNEIQVHEDATVTGNMYVDGKIYGEIVPAPTPGAHDHDYTSPIFQDATTKDDLVVEGNIFGSGTLDIGNIVAGGIVGTSLEISGDTNLQDVFVWKDLVVQDDATVKGDLIVDGIISGTFDPNSLVEAQDFTIWKDLIVYDDATVKDDVRVEGDIVSTRNIAWNGVLAPEVIDTLSVNDTTPDISGANFFTTGNTDTTTILDFDGGILGQHITIVFGDSLTTVKSKNSTSIYLQGQKDFRADTGDVLELLYSNPGPRWYETNRSLNS